MGWEGTAEKDKKSEVEKFLPRAVGKVALGPCVCVWSERAGHSTCSSRLEAEKEFAEEEEEKQKFLLCTQGLDAVCEPIAPPRRCYTLKHQHSYCKHSVDRQHSRLQAQ
ncbi:hypothetical protein C0Q70_12077 [Pomacea canaliculata]|uniref:Uncharacterized protein n=1 Tax=Pomacea canaliculata TaxID=400727 RepID=A0A2T7P0L3_POMCA|nr:hypothetical protein C0Q70_12077 [Pomacea canaliculata]